MKSQNRLRVEREWLIANLGRPLTEYERTAIEDYGNMVFAQLPKPSSAFPDATLFPKFDAEDFPVPPCV